MPVEKRPAESFVLDNAHVRLKMSKHGLLQSVDTNAAPGGPLPLDLHFARFGTRNMKDRSGAYLFLPDGPGSRIQVDASTLVRVVRGPLRQESRAFLNQIEHAVVLVDNRGSAAAAVHLENIVDVRATENNEVAMRVAANASWMDNGVGEGKEAEFFTDLNCYQMLRRLAWKKLPLQANVYPMPCAAMMRTEKSGLRLTLLSGQPLGVGASEAGQLDVFLDRRLSQDDNRGLGEGVQVREGAISLSEAFLLLIFL